MKVLLIGHGRMGRLVEALAPSHGADVVAIVTSRAEPFAIAEGAFGRVDVAIDFSAGAAVKASLEELARRRINVVIGTTGWQADEAACRAVADRAGLGVLAAANFSLGMAVMRRLVAEAARSFADRADVGAWIHDVHHAGKKDAPSGTALVLRAAMEGAGYRRAIDVASTRAGSVPGRHEVGFDAAAETVRLVHDVRDRSVFAHGALEAARWLVGRQGWFGIEDVLG
jgi:4-hydroxy-tetrahydrodipicolinate reductase